MWEVVTYIPKPPFGRLPSVLAAMSYSLSNRFQRVHDELDGDSDDGDEHDNDKRHHEGGTQAFGERFPLRGLHRTIAERCAAR